MSGLKAKIEARFLKVVPLDGDERLAYVGDDGKRLTPGVYFNLAQTETSDVSADDALAKLEAAVMPAMPPLDLRGTWLIWRREPIVERQEDFMFDKVTWEASMRIAYKP